MNNISRDLAWSLIDHPQLDFYINFSSGRSGIAHQSKITLLPRGGGFVEMKSLILYIPWI